MSLAVIGTHITDWGKTWGLLWVRPKTSIGEFAEELFVVRETTEAEEWIDKLDWIPFKRKV